MFPWVCQKCGVQHVTTCPRDAEKPVEQPTPPVTPSTPVPVETKVPEEVIVEFHAPSVPATLPKHSGSTLKIVPSVDGEIKEE